MTNKIQRVLAATDFSKAAQRAVQVAADCARQSKAQLRIVHVTPPKSWLRGAWGVASSAADAIQRHATNALRECADQVDPQRSLELSTGVLSGSAARSIAAAARDFGASLLVIGTRGERDANGESTLGGTAGKLLPMADCPLLLVRRTVDDPVTSVVAALDLSARSRTVLEWAAAAAAGRELHAYHVYDLPFAERLQAYGLSPSAIDAYSEQARAQRSAELGALVAGLERVGDPVRVVVERGDPAVELRRYVEAVRPSLLVVGKHVKIARPSPSSSVGSVCRFIAGAVSADVLAV